MLLPATDYGSARAQPTAEKILRAVSDVTLRSAFLASVVNKEPRIVTNDAAR
jgi:hypothetical protein